MFSLIFDLCSSYSVSFCWSILFFQLDSTRYLRVCIFSPCYLIAIDVNFTLSLWRILKFNFYRVFKKYAISSYLSFKWFPPIVIRRFVSFLKSHFNISSMSMYSCTFSDSSFIFLLFRLYFYFICTSRTDFEAF